MPVILNSFSPERAFLWKLFMGYKKDIVKGKVKPEKAKKPLQHWLDVGNMPMNADEFIGLCQNGGSW